MRRRGRNHISATTGSGRASTPCWDDWRASGGSRDGAWCACTWASSSGSRSTSYASSWNRSSCASHASTWCCASGAWWHRNRTRSNV
ncbi:MAG: hypothetical protein Q8P67_26835 [archaeon]|nr:hypothetical protein [archaeon]